MQFPVRFCFMRLSNFIFAGVVVTALTGAAFPGSSPDKDASAARLLPQEFGGWQLSGSARTSIDPGAADPVNASVLKEYGFTDFASATYTRDDGRKLALKAARFVDASGAYGAYTYY